MTPAEWLANNHRKLDSPFEGDFVKKVLSKVPDFNFRTLQAQAPFNDSEGKLRRCGFAILEGSEIRIAIEIDGYDKKGRGSGMLHDEFLDWQRRHAALVSLGWQVLRFANRDVRDFPDRCAEHVSLLLTRFS